ncbi:hypothetical protein SI65_03890 [Aspergillus cristatus]|uniref:CipC-like antibiotic response protein n=1 Tax=Aspergillus cristatus TaxID=573508 RepID=A0A1E3BIV9_ASPCR|nr:hypothetical protein SI65_03890 [Aspergillus cristatus]
MAWGWDESDKAHRQVYDNENENKHESHLSHEVLAGAASFAGMKAFEDHQRKQGKSVSHSTAKEILAGLAGAEIDKLAETKGLDEADKIKARHHAKKNAEHLYDDHYVNGHGADEYDPNRYQPHNSFSSRGW